MPPHFTRVFFALGTQEKHITDWIWENLEGRFYYGDYYSEKEGGAIDVQKVVAFEQPGEASLFALILDTVNKYDNSVF